MKTVLTALEEELLLYDEHSLEYLQLSTLIEQIQSAEKKTREAAEQLRQVWKEHPLNKGQVLSVTVAVDYVSLFAFTADKELYLINTWEK